MLADVDAAGRRIVLAATLEVVNGFDSRRLSITLHLRDGGDDFIIQRLHLVGRKGVVEDAHIVKIAAELGIRRRLAAPEVVEHRTDVAGLHADVAGRSYFLAIHIEGSTAVVHRDGNMFPCPRSQARPIVELLFLVAILHGKAHATARLGCEEHILATTVAEVEEASHRGSRIGPIDPHGDGHRVHVGNLVGQLHEVAGAIEVERLAARDVLVKIGGRGGADGIETIGRGVSQGVIKLPLSHQTPFAGRLGLNDCRAVRLIFRTVDGFHLILVGHSLAARVVDILTGRHFSGDGVPLLRALLGTQHHVACQIFLSIGCPAQADGGIGSLSRESFGSGGRFDFTSGIER